MTMEFENTFDSMNHAFLVAALTKYGFGDNFIDCDTTKNIYNVIKYWCINSWHWNERQKFSNDSLFPKYYT